MKLKRKQGGNLVYMPILGGTMKDLDTGCCVQHDCSEHIMCCSECHHRFVYLLMNEDGGAWTDEKPRYCPNCRVRVVE